MRQAEFGIHLVDVFQIQGNGFIICDFQIADGKTVDDKGGAFQVGTAHASGHAFLFLKLDVVDETGDGFRVENGTRGARVNQEKGFLTMDPTLDHDMEAFSFNVKQLQWNFNIATHHQKFGLTAYFL